MNDEEAEARVNNQSEKRDISSSDRLVREGERREQEGKGAGLT